MRLQLLHFHAVFKTWPAFQELTSIVHLILILILVLVLVLVLVLILVLIFVLILILTEKIEVFSIRLSAAKENRSVLKVNRKD